MKTRLQTRGSALLLVMWAMLFMSLTVMGVIELVAFGLDDNVTAQKSFRARQLAESGLAIGLHPRVQPGDPVLSQDLPDDEGIDVHIEFEDGRMAINALLQNGATDALHDLFVQWGLSDQDASIVVDSLADWVDSDSITRLNGAENDYYTAQGFPDYPRNQPFQSLDEMLAVRGMDKLVEIKPDWRNYFTVYGPGMLNVNGASADAIQVVTGVSEQQAEALVELRDGPDAMPFTDDDVPFTSLDQVRDALGMSPDDFKNIAARLTLTPAIVRVASRGRVGNYSRTLTIIAAVVAGKRPIPLASSED